jgi:hypothetical protein
VSRVKFSSNLRTSTPSYSPILHTHTARGTPSKKRQNGGFHGLPRAHRRSPRDPLLLRRRLFGTAYLSPLKYPKSPGSTTRPPISGQYRGAAGAGAPRLRSYFTKSTCHRPGGCA